jgi:hypothetical protein
MIATLLGSSDHGRELQLEGVHQGTQALGIVVARFELASLKLAHRRL